MDRRSILILDDDAGFRKTLGDILYMKGYECKSAGDGAGALDLLARAVFDVVLIDLGLPDMPGIEILNRVKADCPSTEAIILTGNASLETAIAATNQGAASYLQKPYETEQLLYHIGRAIERRTARLRENKDADELRKVNEELKTLYETSLAIGRNLEMDKLFNDVLSSLTAGGIFPIEKRGAIFLAEKGGLRLSAHAGLAEKLPCVCGRIAPEDCLCGAAVEAGELVVSSNSSTDRRHRLSSESMIPHGHIVVPLTTAEKVWGVLCLYTRPDAEVGESLRSLFSALGNHLGLAIERTMLYEDARESSLHDPLTGLGNRRALKTRIDKAVKVTRDCRGGASVIMMDVDHFKNYNDTFGHSEGDILLTGLADILRKEIRSADFLFRYGGEEFLAILTGTNLDNAREAAERIRRAVEIDGRVTISLGLALYCPMSPCFEDIIRVADEALYRAKRNGRNRVAWGIVPYRIPTERPDPGRLPLPIIGCPSDGRRLDVV